MEYARPHYRKAFCFSPTNHAQKAKIHGQLSRLSPCHPIDLIYPSYLGCALIAHHKTALALHNLPLILLFQPWFPLLFCSVANLKLALHSLFLRRYFPLGYFLGENGQARRKVHAGQRFPSAKTSYRMYDCLAKIPTPHLHILQSDSLPLV